MANKTKYKLSHAVLRLLNRETLDKITVGDIAREAGVSRKTFYYHFHDIYDLLEWMFDQERLRLTPIEPAPGAWEDTLKGLLQFCLDNRTAVLNLYHSLERSGLERYTGSVIRSGITHFSIIRFDEALRKSSRFAMVLNFYTYGLQGLLLGWIEKGMPGDAGRILADVNEILAQVSCPFCKSDTR